DSIKNTFEKNTPGAGWNGSAYVDTKGVERENFFLLYQDTYVFGKGYMKMTTSEVPEKYFTIQ
ncbi:MAG: hypothetical protein RSC71_06680, partial [Cetobacterium sp.]